MPVPTRAAPSARAALGPPLWTAWNQRGGDSPGSADGARERGGVARSSRTLRTELGGIFLCAEQTSEEDVFSCKSAHESS